MTAGATDKQIAALEAGLGFPVSPELAAAWRAANGSETPLFARPGFFTGYRMLSTREARDERKVVSKRASTYDDYEQEDPRDARVRPGWFHDGWVPFAEFGGGSLLLIEDHSPAESGRAGQIIGFVHDPDEIVYVAESFAKLLAQSIQSLKADPYEFGISTDALG